MDSDKLDEEILVLNGQTDNVIKTLHTMTYGGFADARDIIDIDQKERALDDLKEANEHLKEAFRLLIGIVEYYELD